MANNEVIVEWNDDGFFSFESKTQLDQQIASFGCLARHNLLVQDSAE